MKKLSRFLWKPDAPGSERPVPSFGGLRDTVKASPELDRVRAVEVEIDPSSRIALHSDPRGRGADRFRFLRMRLRELWQMGRLRSILITSPLPGDGKSTVALNLATALAERAKRTVLLIDADLHQRTIAQSFGLQAGPGLAECLEHDLDPLSVLRRVEPLGWYLMPSGLPDGSPTELLQHESLGRIVHRLSSLFDWVVIDSPPVMTLTDAFLLSRVTDGSILVVRADRTPQQAVEESLSALGQQHILGIVLNGAEGLSRRYSKYYGYYGKK